MRRRTYEKANTASPHDTRSPWLVSLKTASRNRSVAAISSRVLSPKFTFTVLLSLGTSLAFALPITTPPTLAGSDGAPDLIVQGEQRQLERPHRTVVGSDVVAELEHPQKIPGKRNVAREPL